MKGTFCASCFLGCFIGCYFFTSWLSFSYIVHAYNHNNIYTHIYHKNKNHPRDKITKFLSEFYQNPRLNNLWSMHHYMLTDDNNQIKTIPELSSMTLTFWAFSSNSLCFCLSLIFACFLLLSNVGKTFSSAMLLLKLMKSFQCWYRYRNTISYKSTNYQVSICLFFFWFIMKADIKKVLL